MTPAVLEWIADLLTTVGLTALVMYLLGGLAEDCGRRVPARRS